MNPSKKVLPPRIADDSDFQNLKQFIDKNNGWTLEIEKQNLQVYTRTVPDCEFNMVKILSKFDNCTPDVVFDVLFDPDYRRVWDSHMLASEEIGLINVNNDVGYYAMSCPPPLKPRDFVLMRSWLDTGPHGEQMLLSRSVPHKDYPPRKGYIRAQSYLTGFIIRSLPSHQGTFFGYVAHCDPQGALPSWLVNKVTHTVGPRMVKDIQKAAEGYLLWKSSQSHQRKPWRFPEEITLQRISLEDQCIDTSINFGNDLSLKHSVPSTSISTPNINSDGQINNSKEIVKKKKNSFFNYKNKKAMN